MDSKTVQVSYFAIFREQRGLAQESCSTESATLADFYAELKARHGFSLAQQSLRVAKNAEFCSWDADFVAGDEIAFIPPVAGG
jgi:molybdopterin converting factor small subunit